MSRWRRWAREVMIHGRPFRERTTLGEWMGFKWGKAVLDIRTEAYPPMQAAKWYTRIYFKSGVEGFFEFHDPDVGVDILRNLIAGYKEKMRGLVVDKVI